MKKNNLQNKFNFFVEADIKKGKDENGKECVIIDGIASSASVADSDDETLYPSGFNLVPFLESGLVNYNHQGAKDSNANIGVPIEAKVINNGKDLYVKCLLWPCDQTNGIVTAYDNFKKFNIDRKIGFSIEGRATYKDPINPKRILKADVTGLAVTFCPKNKNTLMNIIKGEYESAFIDPINDVEDISSLVSEYNTWFGGGEESEFYGTEASVKEFLQNNHEDHIHLLDSLMGSLNKAIDTDAIAPATPESVEHSKKDISNKKISNFGELLKKSDIYKTIAQRYPTSSIAELKNVYSLVESVNNKIFKMEGGQITTEALAKAFSLVDEATNLIKGGSVGDTIKKSEDVIIKSEDKVDFDSDDVKKAVETAKFLQKGGLSKEVGCETLTKGSGISEMVAQASWEKALSETQAQQNGGTIVAESAPIVKSEEVAAIAKSEVEKSLEPVNASLKNTNDALIKGFEGFKEIFTKIQEQNAILVKSNEELALSNKELNEKFEKFAAQPQGRKSAANVAAIEKFQKSNNGEALTGENVYNVNSQDDLDRLTDRLLTEHTTAIEKGQKNDASMFEGAINSIEISKKVPEFAYQRLHQLGIKLVASSK